MSAICKHHMRGACTNDACAFAHPMVKPKVCAFSSGAAPACKFGAACRDWHAPAAKVAKPWASRKGGAAAALSLSLVPSSSSPRGTGGAGGPGAVREVAPSLRALAIAPSRGGGGGAMTAHALLAAAASASGGGGGGSITVYESTTTMTRIVKGGSTSTGVVAAGSSRSGAPKVVEVVLSFDTTGSMYSYLDAVRKALAALIRDLATKAAKHGATLRVGVIAHGDYCDKGSSYVIKYLPLLDISDAASAAKLAAFVEGVSSTGGGDAAECYELALQKALTEMGWSARSARVLVLVGDDLPHEPGYKCGSFENKGDWRLTLANLAKAHVRIFAVQAGANSYANAFWQRLADETQRKRLSIREIATLRDLVLAAAVREMGDSAYAEVGSELRARGWSREVEVTYETIRTVTLRCAGGGGGG